MARARNLKPSFFTDDELAEVAPLGRLLFQGLWCMADRAGRLEDRPKKIKAEVLPYDNCNIEKMLDELARRRFIIRYIADGVRYIQVRQFLKHQNPHVKEPESTIPAPGEHRAKTSSGTVQAPDSYGAKQEVAGRIPDSGFPLPDSSALSPPSGPRLADPGPPDSGLPPPDDARASGPKGNGADEKATRSKAKNGAGMQLDNPAWITATSVTVNRPRREGESYDEWKDAVVTLVQQRQAAARAA